MEFLVSNAKASALIFFTALALFLFRIDQPKELCFDEFHYVPAARTLLQTGMDPNQEHPPLGKMLIALSIRAVGDNPVGWRAASALFGAATLVGIFLIAWILLASTPSAFFVTALTLSNHLLFIQSRIAMLEPFFVGFLIWAMAFILLWKKKETEPAQGLLFLNCAGACLGLASACKWFGVVGWVAWVGFFLLWRRRSTLSQGAVALIVVPLLFYSIPFIPLLINQGALSFSGFLDSQLIAYERQLRVDKAHSYASHWWQWPTLLRPMWYSFTQDGPGYVRGVFLVGNPLVSLTGLLAAAHCGYRAWSKKDSTALLLVTLYAVFLLCWAVLPRGILFFYYYYPAALMLPLLLAKSFQVLHFSWRRHLLFASLSVAVFVYFYPVLAAVRIPSEEFRRWMWLRSWI